MRPKSNFRGGAFPLKIQLQKQNLFLKPYQKTKTGQHHLRIVHHKFGDSDLLASWKNKSWIQTAILRKLDNSSAPKYQKRTQQEIFI